MDFVDKVVDMFNESTWNGVDHKPHLDLVHKIKAPHTMHQQQYKSHVQMATLTASNNVGEGRCSG